MLAKPLMEEKSPDAKTYLTLQRMVMTFYPMWIDDNTGSLRFATEQEAQAIFDFYKDSEVTMATAQPESKYGVSQQLIVI